MQCLNCGGQLEWAGGGKYARCMRDLSLFTQENGQLTPVQVQAPGGGFNPEFNNMFASNLGFGPPPPGAQPMPPQGGGMMGGAGMGGGGMGGNPYGGAPPGPQHDYGKGQFDLGGGAQLRVKINGQSPENFAKNQVSSMVWGWIIGAAVVGLLLIGGVILGVYIYFSSTSSATAASGAPTKAPAAAQWDGKTAFSCKGNDAISLVGVNATAGVTTSGNCQLTLTNVTITAAVPINASGNSKVNVVGGAINGTANAAVASSNAIVTFTGTKVTGKTTKSGNGKVLGAP